MAHMIAVTGGPCSGKTTMLGMLMEEFQEHGIRPLCTPEVATLMIRNAVPDIVRIRNERPELYRHIQRVFIQTQMLIEDRFQEIARRCEDAGERVVIVTDRGIPDCAAYMNGNGRDYIEALQYQDLNPDTARLRYSGVIHLVTAAYGAEVHYSNATNPARLESEISVAQHVDDLTLQAWSGHPHLSIIDNVHSTDFAHKMRRAIQAVEHVLGIPLPLEIERKFVVHMSATAALQHILSGAQKSHIEQIYLKSPEGERIRIRKRVFESGYTLYYETRKRDIGPSKRQETERRITRDEYEDLKVFMDPATRVIRKDRYCFPYNHQYFELDVLSEPAQVVLLEIELSNENDPIALPPFLSGAEDVTDNPRYTNFGIASGSLS